MPFNDLSISLSFKETFSISSVHLNWLTSSIYEVNMNGEQKVIFYKKGMTPADITLRNNKLIIPDMFNHQVIIYDTKTKKESCIK